MNKTSIKEREIGVEKVTVKDPVRIFVVNNNRMFCDIIAQSIERDFPEFEVASETSEMAAQEWLGNERFHLVVTDIYFRNFLPNGMVRLIAENQPRALQLLITAYACNDHKVDAMRVRGVAGFLLMPFRREEISLFVRDVLGLRDELQKTAEI